MQLFYNFVSAAFCDPQNFMGVSLDQNPIIEKIVELNIFIYDFHIEEVELFGEVVQRSIEQFDKDIKLLRYNNHI